MLAVKVRVSSLTVSRTTALMTSGAAEVANSSRITVLISSAVRGGSICDAGQVGDGAWKPPVIKASISSAFAIIACFVSFLIRSASPVRDLIWPSSTRILLVFMLSGSILVVSDCVGDPKTGEL